MTDERPHKRSELRQARRIIVKLGSALLIDDEHGGQSELFKKISKEIAALQKEGCEVILVSSGAIAIGSKQIGVHRKPSDMSERQALAAIGQSRLMRLWSDAFSRDDIVVAQVLLTHEDLRDRKRYLNARNAIESMHAMGAIPIVNENDTVATEEIQLGDNDNLSAQVAALVSADVLIILSIFDGLYDKDPLQHTDATRIPFVEEIDDSVAELGASGMSAVGTGGMATKIQSARAANHFGIPTILASGRREGILRAILDGEDVGTIFLPKNDPVNARKHWIAFTLKSAGKLVVDEGAVRAMNKSGSSLLPSGIVRVNGHFEMGELVEIVDEQGKEIGKGLVRYSSKDIEKISGHRSDEIASILGYKLADVVIHRDDFVVAG